MFITLACSDFRWGVWISGSEGKYMQYIVAVQTGLGELPQNSESRLLHTTSSYLIAAIMHTQWTISIVANQYRIASAYVRVVERHITRTYIPHGTCFGCFVKYALVCQHGSPPYSVLERLPMRAWFKVGIWIWHCVLRDHTTYHIRYYCRVLPLLANVDTRPTVLDS